MTRRPNMVDVLRLAMIAVLLLIVEAVIRG